MATQASQCRGMPSIRWFKSSADSCFHSWRRALQRVESVLDGGWWAATRLPNASQACSIEFRSGDIAGQSMRWISSPSWYSSTRLAVWGRALKSIKMKCGPTAPLKSCTCRSNTSSLCLWAFTAPAAKKCRSVCLLNIMPAYTSTPPPQNGRRFSTIFVGWNLVPRSLQIIVRWESLVKLNLDSSVNSTFLHSFKVQCWCCRLHCKRFLMCTRVSWTHTAGRLAQTACSEPPVYSLPGNSNAWGGCKLRRQLSCRHRLIMSCC